MSYTITGECNGCTACKRICPVGAISGERKSLHEIEDTVCIDCGACGRVCPEEAVRDAFNAKCVRISKLSLWPKPVINEKICASCHVCVDSCPTHCLSMRINGKKDKHERPFLAVAKNCISCRFCQEDCPISAISMEVPIQEAQTGKDSATNES